MKRSSVDEGAFPELSGVRSGIMSQRLETLQKEGEYLTVMCCGESGCGKSTLLQNIFSTRFMEENEKPPMVAPTAGIESTVVSLKVDSVPFYLQWIDTPGYGDQVDVRQGFHHIVNYIDKLYERAMEVEMAAVREENRAFEHLGVDVILYFISPHRLKELDLAMLRMLKGKAAIIPILSKADTMTTDELRVFRREVSTRLREQGIETFREPMAIIASPYVVKNAQGESVIGREYSWGVSQCERDSDLPALRRVLIAEGLQELQRSRRRYYEAFRAKKMREMRGNLPSRMFGFALRTALQTLVLAGAVYALHQGAERTGLYEKLDQLRAAASNDENSIADASEKKSKGWGSRTQQRQDKSQLGTGTPRKGLFK
eukprot:CAMPEP_0184683888 /NCGR_PEP_ID=MMETSP0312-20130426/13024_1 /TAXON_ID=31354 /ORGANISM="Compsopogon coeruleus, Strain SAG 36.94" /LENGTH=371 /DNA_ID=CAMNT_0027136589 /DNA_START=193 /DNA_END=1308 /DNA_ORIENTATION=-